MTCARVVCKRNLHSVFHLPVFFSSFTFSDNVNTSKYERMEKNYIMYRGVTVTIRGKEYVSRSLW